MELPLRYLKTEDPEYGWTRPQAQVSWALRLIVHAGWSLDFYGFSVPVIEVGLPISPGWRVRTHGQITRREKTCGEHANCGARWMRPAARRTRSESVLR